MLNVKMLEVLRNAVPGITRVGVFHQPTVVQRQAMTVVGAGARALSVQLVPIEVRSAGDIDHAAATLAQERVHAFLVLSNPFFHAEKDRFVKLAATMRSPGNLRVPGLRGVGRSHVVRPPTFEKSWTPCRHGGQDPQGRQARRSSVEQPMKIELVINAKTAKTLGLAIPQSLLQRADEVIQ